MFFFPLCFKSCYALCIIKDISLSSPVSYNTPSGQKSVFARDWYQMQIHYKKRVRVMRIQWSSAPKPHCLEPSKSVCSFPQSIALLLSNSKSDFSPVCPEKPPSVFFPEGSASKSEKHRRHHTIRQLIKVLQVHSVCKQLCIYCLFILLECGLTFAVSQCLITPNRAALWAPPLECASNTLFSFSFCV